MAGHSAGTEIERLIQLLSRLPGLGPRSARRAALQLLGKKETLMRPLADALQGAADHVLTCSVCGNLDTSDPCTICADTRRDKGVICVVEQVADLWALERAGANSGQYHVLGGTLSALDGVGPDDLNISGLVTRVSGGDVREVVLALNATVDGQATAHYITDQLEGSGANVSQVAHGVPVGGELDYLDDGTLAAAMKARRPF
ncbi:recombination mediator RecR [Pyruvatibacter mobilis]|uniref:recombination mediator RecR n=1 Tax=Pyruvatibacter mobilis TaxID=1712261 RepID=UPI003BAAB4A8